MNTKRGLIRLGIVLTAILVSGLIVPLLKIYHFSAFNSGVATAIGLMTLVWLIYSTVFWIFDGFKLKDEKK